MFETSENRWYDQEPTLSMAVSLILNTAPRYQDEVTDYLYEQVANINPLALHQVIDDTGFLWFNRRTSMSRRAWMVIESLRFLPTMAREKMAYEMIQTIYRLENNKAAEFESEPSFKYQDFAKKF